MSILDVTQEVRTGITPETCIALGMQRVNTLTPQYIWQIKHDEQGDSGLVLPVYENFVRVYFNEYVGKPIVYYTKDHWEVRGRHWECLEDPSEEELKLLVAGLDAQFNTK